MLNNFFRINFPYGIAKNEAGEWMAFNREYRPIGFNENCKKGDPGSSYMELDVYTFYGAISEKVLLSLADSETAIFRNSKNEIIKVFLYDDKTNPVNQSTSKPQLWEAYFLKLKTLSKLKVKNR